jgi:hypothetical protein
LTRVADEKLNQALATRSSVPHTIEDAQQFVDSLGFDDRVGEHVDRAMTRYMQNANPELYKQMIGQRELQKANDSAYVEWVRMSADPNVAKLTPDEIIAHRTPESQYAFDRDPNARRFMMTPEGIVEAPKRVQTPEEKAQEGFKQDSVKAQLELKAMQNQVAQSGGELTIDYRKGKAEQINRKQLQRELDQEALAQSKEERAMNQEDMKFAADQRAERTAANAQTPEGRKQAAREQRKARLEEIAWRQYQKSASENDPAVARKTYEDAIKTIDELYPDASTPTAQPPPKEPDATNEQLVMMFPDGTKRLVPATDEERYIKMGGKLI